MNRRIAIILLALITVAGCGNKKAEKFKSLPFPDITLPAMIQTQQDAANYYAEHFWDNFTSLDRVYPSDSTMVNGVRRENLEQKFANWVNILDMVSLNTSEKAVYNLFDRVSAYEQANPSSDIFNTFEGLTDKYLYNANSPMRNEEYYLHYARRMSWYSGISQEERDKYVHRVEGCSLNRLGHPAADFRFADKKGVIRTLHSVEAEYTLLFFSNPGCEACLNIINMLKGEPKVASMIAQGRLAVLNIYIDEDLQGWRDYMPIYPENWYNGFDPDLVVRNDELYNVRAIPSLYLLDKRKRVILKDAPENKMMNTLVNL